MAAPAKQEDRTFIGLRDLTDAGKLSTKRREAEALRMVLKREWALNREYYNGNQWSYWNASMLRVEAFPIDQGPAWKVRLQDNKIKPGVAAFVAQLVKTRPIIFAEPNSSGDTDVKAAQMATSLYETLYEDLHLNSATADALHEAALSGGYWLITWDSLAGKPMTFTMGPDGNPILDDELAEVFMDNLEQAVAQSGGDPEQAKAMAQKTVYVGDIAVKVMQSENVLLDPSVDTFKEAKWAICKHSLDPDEIQARWGVKVTPNALRTADTFITFQSGLEERKPRDTVREVFIMYVRPCPALPKGRYVVWIEGPDQILQDMDWPFPFRTLPLVKFPGKYRPNSPYDDPVTTEARPLQKDLNKSLSQIVEHRNLTMRPQMLAPMGSLRQKLTSEPGAVFEYNPVGNAIPTWREMPNLPTYVFEHLANIENSIDDVFNRIPSQRDQVPARADGGDLLEAMQEATSDQISYIITGLEDALADAGTIFAALAQKYYDEPRLLRIRGANGGVQVKKFEAADIDGGFVFKPRYGTGLPMTRKGKQDAIVQLVQEQLIDPTTALKQLDLANYKGLAEKLAADEDQAFREHDKMLRGIPINQPALQQAQQQLQQFQQQASAIMQAVKHGQPVDLDGDGQPDPPQQIMQELQQQLQQLEQAVSDAPWQPLDFENWESHIDTHAALMKTTEFENYPPQVQAIFLQHYNLTYQRWMDVRFAMPDPNNTPKVQVRAMGTVSAPVMTQILQKSGVKVTEQDVAAQPLETQVIESLNQPKVDPAGNDPLTQADQLMSMQQSQDQHILQQATAQAELITAQAKAGIDASRSAQDAQNAEDSHTVALATSAQQLAIANQKHQQEMQFAAEKHQAALEAAKKKANEKPAKPAKGK